jgi:hypothetical protein
MYIATQYCPIRWSGSVFPTREQGNLCVEIHFDEALAGTINVVLYAEFDNVIEIDRNRQVLFDYSA